ncbi:hypothetical protein ABMA27_008114 [Loxostege sticticalis]|uniref:unspecific monooxygenase n=1 Tax=Loxostege sticticalis TaxID=481309 RepID=A0ABR3HEH1_LOXSC
MFWSILLSIFAGAIALAYYFSTCNFDYWKKKNVPYVKPVPLLGNYGSLFLQRKHFNHTAHDIYKEFPNEPVVGAFMGTVPTLVVKDPEYIKKVTTKDFYYYNSRGMSDYADHEAINKNIFSSHGDYWKTLRTNLSPVFSTSKMKNMFHLIADCSYAFEKLIDEEASATNSVMPAHQLISRFTMACITSAAFGVDSETMGKGYKTNPFTRAGEMVFNKSRKNTFKNYFRMTWPGIFYLLRLKAFPEPLIHMFHDFMTSVFEARNHKPTSRNDFVDFILGFKEKEFITGETLSSPTSPIKRTSVEVSDDFLVSNCLIFFLAGFETSATTSSYTLYELAKHPEAQNKLLKEIDDYLERTGNKIHYESTAELPYLQACVDEALRLYPVLGVSTREVVEEVTLGSVRLDKGVLIHIPTYSLQRDPKYFPEPEKYRPERFLGEEKQKIVPHTYMPFGDGPRLCIGMRFARMQMTAGLVTLLKKYRVELAPGTPTVPDWDPLTALLPSPKKPLNLKFIVREGWENRVFVKPENRTSCKA